MLNYTEGRRTADELIFLKFFSSNGVSPARLNSEIRGFRQYISATLLQAIGNNRQGLQNVADENKYSFTDDLYLIDLIGFYTLTSRQKNTG